MVLSALLLVSAAIVVCAVGVRLALGTVGLSAMQTLIYLGIAEEPAPPAPRRRTSTT
ncbi:MAG: hypothetical protein QOD86_2069 [Miltoncostaeaceae bacterium]|jgi:hypothetical protein|nr:hypothetical protein [Miltoncostaeaceae bacterium]